MLPAFLDDHVPFVHIAEGRDVRSQMSLFVTSVRPNADEELTIRNGELEIENCARAHHDRQSAGHCA